MRAPRVYESACGRLERYVEDLARTCRIEVAIALELDVEPGIYRIKLSNRQKELVVPVDAYTFVGADEFFEIVVLPRISAAIRRLATPN